MIRKQFYVSALIFLLVFSLGLGNVYSAGVQERSAPKAISSLLLPLVGQKCTLVLQSGDKINGTLWDYGDDFVTLKVKKGLLYSKAEKFGLSEIKYLEDASGKMVVLTQPLKTERREIPKEPGKEKKPTPLFFSTEDIDDSKAPPQDDSNQYKKPFEMLDSDDSKDRLLSTPGSSSTGYDNSKRPDSKRYPSYSEIPRRKYSKFSPSNKKKPDPKTNPFVAMANARRKQAEKEAELGLSNSGGKKMRILEYQASILLGAALLIVALLVIFKVVGLRGSTYGKYSLFPAKIIKLDGKYGIIDQGVDEGVKVDDVIRLYRKIGRKVVYKGKVQVKRVISNTAAVELIDVQKNSQLQVGDVGFRDRNFILTSIKRVRIITSAGLKGFAKGLAYTAENIEVKTVEPKINLDIETKEHVQIIEKKPVTTIGFQQKPAPKRTPFAKSDDGPKMGFGLEE